MMSYTDSESLSQGRRATRLTIENDRQVILREVEQRLIEILSRAVPCITRDAECLTKEHIQAILELNRQMPQREGFLNPFSYFMSLRELSHRTELSAPRIMAVVTKKFALGVDEMYVKIRVPSTNPKKAIRTSVRDKGCGQTLVHAAIQDNQRRIENERRFVQLDF